jgi:hypothetical protein
MEIEVGSRSLDGIDAVVGCPDRLDAWTGLAMQRSIAELVRAMFG